MNQETNLVSMTTSSPLVFMVTRWLPFSVQDRAAEAPDLFFKHRPSCQNSSPGVLIRGGQITARAEPGVPPVFMSEGLLEQGHNHVIFALPVAASVWPGPE